MHWWSSRTSRRHSSTHFRSWSTCILSSYHKHPSRRSLIPSDTSSGSLLTPHTQTRLRRLDRRLPHTRPRPRHRHRPPNDLRHALRNAPRRALHRALRRPHGRPRQRTRATRARPARAADRLRLRARLPRPWGHDRGGDRRATYVCSLPMVRLCGAMLIVTCVWYYYSGGPGQTRPSEVDIRSYGPRGARVA